MSTASSSQSQKRAISPHSRRGSWERAWVSAHLLVFSQSLLLSPRTANHERRGSIVRSIPHPPPKSIKQPPPTGGFTPGPSSTRLPVKVCAIRDSRLAHYVWLCSLPVPVKHVGLLSLSTHIDPLSSFASNFMAFHHTAYQTCRVVPNRAPAHEERSGLQLLAVSNRAAPNLSAQPRGRVSSGQRGCGLESRLQAAPCAVPDSG